jgi:predicted ATPase
VSALERGQRRRPHVETVRALSAALDLTGAARDAFVSGARADAERGGADEPGGGWLPLSLTPLLGRDDELRVLRGWLADPTVRLVTLTGPGGVGKTRLALEMARNLAGEEAVRVEFVPLAAIREPALVAPRIAEAVGLADTTAPDLPTRLRAACADRPTLLVLDNFEQVLEAAPLLAELLSSAGALRLLVTSRAALRLRGERECVVGPLRLDADAGADATSAEELMRSPAVRLFLDRVRDVQPDFQLTPANAPAVAAICRRLDALPLALELAAPWMKVLTAEDLLERLERDALFSAGVPRDLPARQQTMNATVAWSYQLLDPVERQAFRRFGALPGRFPIDAAAAVLAGHEEPAGESDALRAAAALIDKSLLVRGAASVVATCPLYEMLETVRAYAALELAASGERDHAMEGLVRYCATEAALAASGLVGPAQIEWLDRVREDLESYRGALAWLIERDRAAEAADIAGALMFFWLIRGHTAEGLRWYERVLARPALAPAATSRALLGSGVMRYAQGDLQAARTVLGLAHATAAAAGAPEIVAQAEGMLGHVEHAAGHIDVSREWFTRSFETFQSLGVAWGIGHALTGLARAAIAAGEGARAERLLDEAVAALQEAGPWFRSLTRNLRAIMAIRRGDADEALVWVRDNLAELRELGDKFVFVYALVPLGAAAALKGNDAWVAQIVGLRDAITESTGAVVVDQSTHDLRERGERAARARLGRERWAAAYAVGRRSEMEGLLKEIEAALGDVSATR